MTFYAATLQSFMNTNLNKLYQSHKVGTQKNIQIPNLLGSKDNVGTLYLTKYHQYYTDYCGLY